MSYWTKRRKIQKNVSKHIKEIENELSIEEEPQSFLCNDSVNSNSDVQLAETFSDIDDNLPSSSGIQTNEHTLIYNASINSLQCEETFDDNCDFDKLFNTSYYLLSYGSESDSDSGDNDEGINEKLAHWAVDCNIPNDSMKKLLSILKPHITDLPVDPRTLLGTKLSYQVKDICGGQYYHFGLSTGIMDVLTWQKDDLNVDSIVKIQLSIDGLPLFKSSSGQFWPILGRVENIGNTVPFIIGLFYGTSKPDDVSVYLHDVVEELNELLRNGLNHDNLHYDIIITSIICDSPARAFIKNVKQYSGYYGCDKCIQSGVWEGKMTYPDLNSPVRSDEDFVNRVQPEHHKGQSPFEGIVGMVTQFPLDYMHLVCLGVVRRLILSWLKGNFKVRIGGSVSKQISTMLYSFRHFIPVEFARKPRGFGEIERWKATEFRQFLLYTGPVVLRQFLNDILYKNFMLLSVSLHILLNSYLVQEYSDYAHRLLKTFVQHYKDLYGQDNVVFNIHGLLHLSMDAKNYGSLDNISSFPFENFLMKIKKMVRKPTFPLQQVIRRLSEKKQKHFDQLNIKTLENEHTSGPLMPGFDASNCKQYKSVKLGKFLLNLKRSDQYCRIDNHICKLENILQIDHGDGEIHVVFRKFSVCQKFFDIPLDSDLLGIYLVSSLSDRLFIRQYSDIQSKYILLPYRNENVAMPFTDTTW